MKSENTYGLTTVIYFLIFWAGKGTYLWKNWCNLSLVCPNQLPKASELEQSHWEKLCPWFHGKTDEWAYLVNCYFHYGARNQENFMKLWINPRSKREANCISYKLKTVSLHLYSPDTINCLDKSPQVAHSF